MDQVMPEDGQSKDIIGENVEALKTLFPDAFTEDGIDFDVLRQLLGDEVADGEEKYGLTWHGKKKARQIALTPSTGTLRPCQEESVDWDTTQNLFIEGDNLEVLKLLQRSYAGKVKMIYIDPPYNTGGEFIYPDKYQENLETYLRYTGQVDPDMRKLSSSTETSGRKHTKWASMMLPRLMLARHLLCEDGVIFITIDDNEQAILKCMCDEIFGEENFVSCVAWQKVFAKKNKAMISGSHDHVLVYAKNVERWTRHLLPRSEGQLKAFKNPDSDPRGRWQSVSFSVQSEDAKKRAPYRYEIELPSGRSVTPPPGRHWNGLPDKFEALRKDNRIWFGADGDNAPRAKVFLSEVQNGIVPDTWWKHEDTGNNQEAKKEILELFGDREPFSTPKPTKLIRRMLQIATSPDDKGAIVLDFFAGSGTTADAIMRLNAEDGGARRFVLIQLPEPTGDLEFETISKIGMERVRRAAKSINDDNLEPNADLGFKVFKLDSSNIQAWNPDRGDLDQSLLDHQSHLVEGRSQLDVLYELLLKRGVDLTVPIEKREVGGKAIYSIGYGVLFACLAEKVDKAVIEALAQSIIDWHRELAPGTDTQVVFRDSAFEDDIAKSNMTAILEQNGISHVRSL